MRSWDFTLIVVTFDLSVVTRIMTHPPIDLNIYNIHQLGSGFKFSLYFKNLSVLICFGFQSKIA